MGIIFLIPVIAYLIGKYGTVGFYSARDFIKRNKN